MRLPGFATRNLRLKAIAAGLATITWAGVVYASNPPDTRSVTVKVPQDSGAVAPYVLVHAIPDLVVRVSGTREHLNAFDPSDLVVSVNYRGIRHSGVQQVPVTVINNDRDVALDNPPTGVTADVDHKDSRAVPVTIVLSQQPPQGYVVSTESASPSSVTVIGPQHQLAGLEARVTIDLSTQKTNFQADEAVALYDSSGQRRGDFGVTSAGHAEGTVLVTITVVASLTSRATVVLPRVTGSPASGHLLVAEVVTPPTVVLNGPQDLLNNLDSIPTETLSVSGISGTLSFSVHIVTPAGVTATPRTVTVTVTAIPISQVSPSAGPTPTPAPTPTPSPSPT